MEPVNVLVTMPFPTPLIEKLAAVSPRVSVIQRASQKAEEITDLLPTLDVLYSWRVFPAPSEAPRLRWVQLHQAGIDMILDQPLYANSDVIFTTSSGIHAVPIAEYVLGQMLALSHHFIEMMEDKTAGTWAQHRWNRYVPQELYGATIGIIGYGNIGRQVARLAQALGMKVLAVKRDVRHPAHDDTFILPGTGDSAGDIPDRIYPPEALHSFLGECDYVVVTAPLTDRTRHLMDAEALRAMKANAVLINVARGGLVDEEALIDALERRQIGGAALDVFSEEPLAPDSRLWKLPNVILSPHVSGFTPYYDDRATDLFAENLRRFLAGERLINVVDRAHHY